MCGPLQHRHNHSVQDPASLLDGLVDCCKQAQTIAFFPGCKFSGIDHCSEPKRAALLQVSQAGFHNLPQNQHLTDI